MMGHLLRSVPVVRGLTIRYTNRWRPVWLSDWPNHDPALAAAERAMYARYTA